MISKSDTKIRVTYDYIMHQDEEADDYRLANFETIQTSVYVNRVRAENGKHTHVNVIKIAQLEKLASNQSS